MAKTTTRPARAVKLEVVTEPDPSRMSILVPAQGVAPVIRGAGGSIDLVCPGCRLVLVAGVEPGQLQNIVIRCPACGVHGRANAPDVQ